MPLTEEQKEQARRIGKDLRPLNEKESEYVYSLLTKNRKESK